MFLLVERKTEIGKGRALSNERDGLRERERNKQDIYRVNERSASEIERDIETVEIWEI